VGQDVTESDYLYSSRPGQNRRVIEWRKSKLQGGIRVLLPPYRVVNVNHQTGKVSNYVIYSFPLYLTSFQPKITQAAAIEKAKAAIREDRNSPYRGMGIQGGDPGQVAQIFLSTWNQRAEGKNRAYQRLVWEVHFDGRRKAMNIGEDGKPVGVWVPSHWFTQIGTNNGFAYWALSDRKLIDNSLPSSNIDPIAETEKQTTKAE